MATHIIIDGYNFIRQSPELSRLDAMDLEAGRDALVDKLHFYKKKKRHKITVVFDGQGGNSYQEQRENIKGINIIFSPIAVEADELIKRLARKGREQCVVVTSDRELMDYARGQQAVVIPAKEFDNKLSYALYSLQKGVDEAEAEYMTGRVRKKKGPARRLPKKARQGRSKINKL